MGLLHPASELVHFPCGDFPPCLGPRWGFFLGCDLAFFVILFSFFFQCLGRSPGCLLTFILMFLLSGVEQSSDFSNVGFITGFAWNSVYDITFFCLVFLCLLGVQAAGGLSVVLLHSRLFLDTGHTEQITSEESWSYSSRVAFIFHLLLRCNWSANIQVG